MRFRFLTLFSLLTVLIAFNLVGERSNAFNLVLAQGAKGIQVDTVNNSFTYQGRLANASGPVSDTCDFQFQLWAQASGTSDGQIGSTQTVNNVSVTNGEFSVTLNKNKEFDHNTIHGAFYYGERWLEISVRCPSGSGTFTTLTSRQPILAVPYAVYAKTSGNSGFGSNWSGSDGWGLLVKNSRLPASYGKLPQRAIQGVMSVYPGEPTPPYGVIYTGVHGVVEGEATLLAPIGVYGEDLTGSGVGVQGNSKHIGVRGDSTDPNAGFGVYGSVSGNNCSPSPSDPCTSNAAGVFGTTEAVGAVGVRGYSKNGAGVEGISDNSAAGRFIGRVDVYGNLYVNGTISKSGGSFKIDHPLDPTNKYLYHSFVESPDMMNIYNGNSSLDENGEAWVDLPDWFEALNQEFRYQLTAINMPGPNLYIAQEIQNNRFKIAGGQPGAKVSWQITGIRHDPYAEAHRIPVEEDKPINERGTYLHPKEWNQSESLGFTYLQQEATKQYLTALSASNEDATQGVEK